MSDTSIGTASMRLTLDTADYTVALDRAKAQQAGLGEAAAQEADKMTAAQKRVVASLDNQIAKLGLTREQWLQYKVITQTTGETQTALLTKIKANTVELTKQGNAAEKAGVQFNKYGISAKQEAAALRQVPAQLTDIFVSLQGGQNPLTVLLQQGGQLKDIFGGIVPAARALGGALLNLINPYTVLAAAIGAVGFTYLQAEERSNRFNAALILTGQQGRLTADDLGAIANRLDNLSGVTSRQAAAALTEVVSNGRIAASQYELITKAAVAMQDATGKAISETVDEYARIAADPVNAVLQLNESEHFLTESIYERIKALQEAGDIEGAAALASETRANAQIERAGQVRESLGLVSGAWYDIKNATGEAWDEAIHYFDNLDHEAKDAAGTLGRLWQAWQNFKSSGPAGAFSLVAALSPQSGAADPGTTPDPAVNSAVQKQLDALIAGNRSRQERQTLEETQIVNLYKQLGISKDDKRVQDALNASRQRYQESLPKGRNGAGAARSLANAQAAADLEAIKNIEQTARDQISNTSKVLEAQYGARLVTTQDYYAQQRTLLQQDTDAQEKSLTAQIAYLEQRNVAGKDSVNVNKQIADLEQRLAKVRADSATQLVILGIREDDINKRRTESLEDYTLALQKNLDAAKLASDAEIIRITQGAREAEQTTKIAKAYADLSDELQRLALLKQRDPSNAGLYDSEMEAAKRNTDAVVEHIVDAYDRMKDAQADWLNGLSSGLQDWMDNAADVASQVNKLTQSTLDTVVDGLTQAATTGKLAWRDMLADIGKQITKFMIQQAVLQFIKYFMDAWLGYGSGPGGSADPGNQPIGSAKGNVFTNSPSLSAYSGTVVTKPTFFAKGGNVMGEAGPEGIFPLKRGSDGKLGVVAHGGGGGPVYVTTEVHVHSDGSSTSTTRTAGEQAAAYRELGDKISTGAKQEIQRALMPGGQIWKAQQGR